MSMETSMLIENVEKALETTRDHAERFTLQNYLVELYRKTNRTAEAVALLRSIIETQKEDNSTDSNTLAALYNNLGLLLKSFAIQEAIASFREADTLYRKKEKENVVRIAGVNYQLSQLFTTLKDDYYTKKYLKECLLYFDRDETGQVFEAKARAHDQLGQLYSEKLLLFDARNHYKKALDIYQKIYSGKEEDIAMIIGSLLNNLGVTYRQMESFKQSEDYFKRTLDHYETLESKSHGYLPWIGSTLTNLSNLYAEHQSAKEAQYYGEKALKVYTHLSKEEPEHYEHYLATSLHNMGVLFMENDPDLAEDYFRKAIALRKDLADNEPHAFNADLAASLMNLVELYHSRWEFTLKKEFKSKALALLGMTDKIAKELPVNHPAVQNILNDLDYYNGRFRNEDVSGLHYLKITREIMPLRQEVNSTIVPGEKIPYQEKILKILRGHVMKFPGHYRGMESFSDALSEQAWYYLRLGKTKKAASLLREMRQLKSDLSSEAKCNLAHYYLLSGNELRALEFYKQILPLKNEDKKPMKETLIKDFSTLRSDGILMTPPQAVEALLENYA